MITLKMLEQDIVTPTRVNVFCAEASDLRLQGWPERLETELGNGLPFLRTKVERDRDNDITQVTYHQANGCIELVVFND